MTNSSTTVTAAIGQNHSIFVTTFNGISTVYACGSNSYADLAPDGVTNDTITYNQMNITSWFPENIVQVGIVGSATYLISQSHVYVLGKCTAGLCYNISVGPVTLQVLQLPLQFSDIQRFVYDEGALVLVKSNGDLYYLGVSQCASSQT